MADTQILPIAVEAAPADWVLPDATEVTPQAIYASFDGTGAAGSFLPTLTLLSDSGHKLASIPMDNSVAAGSSVEATWGPFLRPSPQAAVAGATLKAIHLYDATLQAVASGNDIRVKFATASSFDSATFGVTLSGGSVVQIIAKKQGWYGLFADLDWAVQPASGYTEMQFLDPGDVQSSYAMSYSHPTSLHIAPRPTISLVRYCPAATGFGDTLPTKFELWIAQNSGISHNTSQVGWEMVYFGNSDF